MNLTKKQENTLEEIKSFESEPKVVQLFDNKEISKLLDLYNSLPITTHNITQKTIKKRWLQNYSKEMDKLYVSKLKEVLGDFKMDNLKSESGEDFFGLFQESYSPLKLHVDSGFFDSNLIYKQTLVPLSEFGETVIFKNRWYGFSTNFIHSDHEKDFKRNITEVGRNRVTNEHKGIYGDKAFDKDVYKKYLSHENYENLKGLEVAKVYKWKMGEMLIFDRTALHCSSCNIKNKKIGLATFTKK